MRPATPSPYWKKLRYLQIIMIALVIAGCNSQKITTLEQEMQAANQRIKEMEALLTDSDKDGVADYLDVEPNTITGVTVDTRGRSVDLNLNGIPDELEAYIDNALMELKMTSAPIEAEDYFTSMESSDQVKITSFFKNGESLKEGNDKLVRAIKAKLKFDEGEYKYFSLSNGGFGIITKIQCITEGGAKNASCTATKTCGFLNLNCVEEGYSQFFLFLVTKKDMEGNERFSLKEFQNRITDGDLDSNYNAIPRLKSLITEKNKFNEDYSFYIRLFEIRRATMSKPAIIDPTYDFDGKMRAIFKN